MDLTTADTYSYLDKIIKKSRDIRGQESQLTTVELGRLLGRERDNLQIG